MKNDRKRKEGKKKGGRKEKRKRYRSNKMSTDLLCWELQNVDKRKQRAT